MLIAYGVALGTGVVCTAMLLLGIAIIAKRGNRASKLAAMRKLKDNCTKENGDAVKTTKKAFIPLPQPPPQQQTNDIESGPTLSDGVSYCSITSAIMESSNHESCSGTGRKQDENTSHHEIDANSASALFPVSSHTEIEPTRAPPSSSDEDKSMFCAHSTVTCLESLSLDAPLQLMLNPSYSIHEDGDDVSHSCTSCTKSPQYVVKEHDKAYPVLLMREGDENTHHHSSKNFLIAPLNEPPDHTKMADNMKMEINFAYFHQNMI